MNFKAYTVIFILFISNSLFSQKGKNGAANITLTNTKVNEFTALTSNAAVGAATINVASSLLNTNARFTSTLTPGDLIMVIQMQGALTKLIPTPVWAPDSTYGNIYSYGTAGNYEFVEVKSVISTTQIEINCGLTNSYNSSGKTQIVRVPRYTSLTVASGGVLTTDAWNGTIGGILVAEVDGNTTINAGGLVSTNGLGFRGGVAIANGGTGNGNFVTKNPSDGAEKGEGIGSDRLINSTGTNDTLGKQCKGANANGGGGGNANNCGGGGGGNAGNISSYFGLGVTNTTYSTAFNLEYAGRASIVSSGGGKGGYGTSTVNGNPTTNAPNNPFWGTFERPKYGGFGGRPLDYSTGKIFMGGGGGAGHMSASQSNGAGACSGGAGGGIIYILSYGTISGTGIINSNGANGANAFGTPGLFTNTIQGIDGSGGAGAGGTIILRSIGAISTLTANANGGTGGNQVISGASTNEGQGPGGGGGGGYIAANGSAFTQNVIGGTNGVTNAVAFVTAFPMNGATSGNSGLNNQLSLPAYTITPSSSSQTLCSNQSTTISATSNNPSSTIQWFNTSTGGSAVATGTLYSTPVYTTAGTYTVYAGSCPGIYRLPIIITVNPGANIAVTSATICAGQSALLTASGASTYSWVAGPNTNTISVSPSSTTVYTVNGSSGLCNGSQTATVTVGSNIAISINSPTICLGASAVLTATGATTYTWSPGLNTASITVNPTTTTIYTVSGSVGSCAGTGTSTVTINQLPILTLTASPTNICTGQSSTLSVNGANTYTWSNGVTGNSQTVSPLITTSYSVIGTNSVGCINSNPFSVTVNVAPTPTLSVSNSSICAGQTATLTATGATSYTWSTNQTSAVINPLPTGTTVYTVSGSNGGCASQYTVVVTVSPLPTVNAVANVNSGCSVLCVNFSEVTNAISNSISYNFGDGTSTFTTNPTHCYSNTGTFTPTVVATDAVSGCMSLVNILSPITITAKPVASFNIQEGSVVTAGTSVHLVNTSANATNYSWTLCNNANFITTDVTIPTLDTGICCIKLVANNTSNCYDTMVKCIDIVNEASISIPNVFTPNNDTKNDVFKIKTTGVKTLSCTIFDRWGLKMYDWNDVNGFWDGKTTTGVAASDGSYFFIITYTDFKDVSKTEKGFLSLFRN